MFERLHIDFTKHGWWASNQRDEFPQMIRWLSRQEKVLFFNNIVTLCQKILSSSTPSILAPAAAACPPSKQSPISIAKYPNYPNHPIPVIEQLHAASQFSLHLKHYLNTFLDSFIYNRSLDSTPLPFNHIDVFNMFCFHPVSLNDEEEEYDLVKAMPISKSLPAGCFDTVIVLDKDEAESTGMAGKYIFFLDALTRNLSDTLSLGTQVARVKVIFTLPKTIVAPGMHIEAPQRWPKGPLAYVEWYTRQATVTHKDHGMYHISKAKDSHGRQQGTIIPLANIRQSCMLFPVFSGHADEARWLPHNVLDKADSFLINNWLNKYSYQTIW